MKNWTIIILTLIFISPALAASRWTEQTPPTSGGTWVDKSPAGLIFSLEAVQMTSASIGYAVVSSGGQGYYLKTTDGGENWALMASFPNATVMNDLSFADDNPGWLVADSSGPGIHVYKTTSGGTTWSAQGAVGIDSTLDYKGVHFINSNIGWIVGGPKADGAIYKTTDGGATWGPKSVDQLGPTLLNSIFFIDSQTGWVVGNNGTISKTTDGGSTIWPKAQPVGTSEDLLDVFFLDINNGFVVGNNGTLLQTTDVGTNWTAVAITSSDINGVFIQDALNTWFVGQTAEATSSVIYKNVTDPTAVAPTVSRDVVAMPSPNKNITPANPEIIQLTPRNDFSGPVTIYLMSITGQIIKTLQATMTRDEITNVLYDGTDLFNHLVAPGVYRIQIISGGKTVGSGKLTVAR